MAFVEGYSNPSEEPDSDVFNETVKQVALQMLDRLTPKSFRAKTFPSILKAVCLGNEDPNRYYRAVVYAEAGDFSLATDFITKAAKQQAKSISHSRRTEDIHEPTRREALLLVEASWVLQRYRADILLARGMSSPEGYAVNFIATDQQRYLRELQITNKPTPFSEYNIYQSCDRILAATA